MYLPLLFLDFHIIVVSYFSLLFLRNFTLWKIYGKLICNSNQNFKKENSGQWLFIAGNFIGNFPQPPGISLFFKKVKCPGEMVNHRRARYLQYYRKSLNLPNQIEEFAMTLLLSQWRHHFEFAEFASNGSMWKMVKASKK